MAPSTVKRMQLRKRVPAQQLAVPDAPAVTGKSGRDIPLAWVPVMGYAERMKSTPLQAAMLVIVCLLVSSCGTSAPSMSLHSAVEQGNLQAVQQHIAAKTDLDAKDESGWTALHLAAMKGDLAIVQALVAGGADASVTGPQGKTPMDVAREKGQGDVVDYLQAQSEGGGRRLIDGGTGVSDVLDAL